MVGGGGRRRGGVRAEEGGRAGQVSGFAEVSNIRQIWTRSRQGECTSQRQ